MTDPKTALMTVVGQEGPPSLAEAAAQLGVAVTDLNADFGIVVIDPDRKLYSVEVHSDRLPPRDAQSAAYRGPFSNPRIEPFGPVASGETKPREGKKQ